MRGVVVVCAVFAGPAAVADQVALNPAKDNTLFESVDGSLSSGAGPALFIGLSGGQIGDPIRHRAVLAFDLSSIPDGSTITSAALKMSLVAFSGMGGTTESLTLHRILADWGEGTSSSFGGGGVPATAGDATWLHTFYPGSFWAGPGGDHSATASSSQVVGPVLGDYTWSSGAQMVSDVQGWLDAPGTNFGWLVLGNEVELFSSKKFGSREGPGSAQPELVVQFDPPPDPCPWDCDGGGDALVGTADLLVLLGHWGAAGPCDLDGNNVAGVADLLKMLGHWGPCPSGECGVPQAGSCFQDNNTPGCNNEACCTLVCASDPSCCDIAWDTTCKDLGNVMCGNCGDGAAGDCCQSNGSPGCSDGTCCRAVCESDGYCCNTGWDILCVGIAAQLCSCP